jgi:hypothetical protein
MPTAATHNLFQCMRPLFLIFEHTNSTPCSLTVCRYAGPPIELVFYIGDEGPESGWWPFGTASTFNDLIDKSVGCKVTHDLFSRSSTADSTCR